MKACHDIMSIREAIQAKVSPETQIDLSTSVTRPVKQLYGYIRVRLNKGAEARITFTFPVYLLSYYNRKNEYIIEPGEVKVFIGSSSDDIRASTVFNILGEKEVLITQKAFFSDVEVEL